MRCLNCKYDLRQLSEHRCPECGREFDPDDPQTFELPTQQTKQSEGFHLLAIMSGALLVLLYFAFAKPSDYWRPAILLIVFIASALLAVWYLQHRRTKL